MIEFKIFKRGCKLSHIALAVGMLYLLLLLSVVSSSISLTILSFSCKLLVKVSLKLVILFSTKDIIAELFTGFSDSFTVFSTLT